MRVCGWGLGTAHWRGSQRGSLSAEVGPWVGVQGRGLGSVWQEGGSEGRGLGPGTQEASRCLSGQGKHWLPSLPFLRSPPPLPPAGSPLLPLDLNCGWVPLGVGSPSLPQPPLRDAGPGVLAFTFAPLSLPSLPQDPRSWRGPR